MSDATTMRLYRGDVRDALRHLADRSVQCVVTSPPYLGLRSYAGPPAVWGGDHDCDHVWEPFVRPGKSGGDGERSAKHLTGRTYGNFQQVPATEQAVCARCGASRTWLGLEPALEQYVAHLVEVCRGIWRVLDDRGVFWLNLGDSYAGSNKGVDAYPIDTRPGRTARVGATRAAIQGHDIAVPGVRAKSLIGIPWRVALALQQDRWIVRNSVAWEKPDAMPESVHDRFTRSYEDVFMLTKQGRYDFYPAAVAEPASWDRWGAQTSYKTVGRAALPRDRSLREIRAELAQPTRNRRTVWRINTAGSDYDYCRVCDRLYVGAEWRRLPTVVEDGRKKRQCPSCRFTNGWIAHYAAFPVKLVEVCMLASTQPGDVVLDPFVGSGTTLLAAGAHGRIGIGIDSSADYITLARARIEHAGYEVHVQ